MYLLRRKLGLALAVSLARLAICLATAQKHREQFEKELAENATLPTVACRGEEARASEAVCLVSKFDQSCNASLKADNGSVARLARAMPFGRDRAIVIWSESNIEGYRVKFRVIKLATCQSICESKLAIGNEDSYLTWAVNVATYDSVFDVFYVEEASHKYCKQSFDAGSGEAIGKLVCIANDFSPPFYTTYYPIEPYSSKPRGYVLLLPSYERTIDAWFIGPDDDVIRFASYSRNLPARRFAVSTTYDTITICHQQRLDADSTLVNCTRFNMISGRKKQETQLKLVDRAKISDVFNLSDGGYLLALSKRSPMDCRSNDGERLMKVSKDNVTFFAIERAPVKCDCALANLRTSMFENERREYCLATICNRVLGSQQLKNNVFTQCFSDRELAVKTFTV